MIRALIVAYHFPPIGGGGVQRAAKFARYLPEFGIEPVIFTGPGRVDGFWTPHDPTMVEEVAGLSIFRAAGPVPSGDALESAYRSLGMLSPFSRWWVKAIKEEGPRAGTNVDVVVGELVPYETAYGVETLARELGVPWVADLQDPWALDEMWLYPSFVHRYLDRVRMRRTLRSAAAVSMNTPQARMRLITAFPEFQQRRVYSITNGFDPDDLASIPIGPRADKFRIVHSGYLYTHFGTRSLVKERLRRLAGGMPFPDVNFLTRSHVYLLRAIDQLLRDDPALGENIELHFVGQETARDLEVADRYPFVEFHGYRSHHDSLVFLRNADLLFLPMQDLPEGTRAGLVPGKTYEYMASGTPILAAVPDGDARDILRSLGNTVLCRPTDVDGMARAIREQYERWRAGTPPPKPSESVLARYERQALTRTLANAIEAVVDDASSRSANASGVGRRTGAGSSRKGKEEQMSYRPSLDGLLHMPRAPRWKRAVHRLSAPVMSRSAARDLRRRLLAARDVDEIVASVFLFSKWGVNIRPLQLPRELARFLEEVRARRPQTILEIGTALGGTFCGFAWAASDDATIVSVDLRHGDFGGGYPPWRAPLYRSFARGSQQIHLIEGDSHASTTLEAVKRAFGGAPIDVVFIDGDHTYEGVKADYELYSPLVAPGGLIAFHDIAPEDPSAFPGMSVCVGGVPRFWQELRESTEHFEIVENWAQGAFGIGVVRHDGKPLDGGEPDPD